MAQASMTVTALKRFTTSFVNDEGTKVVYHEVIGLDEQGEFVKIRSSRKEDLAAFVPDGPATTFDAEFRKMDQIRCPLVRPVGAPAESNDW